MPIEAEIEVYGILEFPDGTSKDVIQSVVKRKLSERSQPTAAPATTGEMRRREEQPGFVLPTHVGMVRLDQGRSIKQTGSPHPRGDGP